MSGDTSKESLALPGSGDMAIVLGIVWDPGDDIFKVKVRVNLSRKYRSTRLERDLNYDEIPSLLEMKISKRMLLSITNSCYDPLGLLSPITIRMKIAMRKLYSKDLKLSWDEDLNEITKREWVHILMTVKNAEVTSFQRCIKPKDVLQKPDLIICNDGSESAMYVCMYVFFIKWVFTSKICYYICYLHPTLKFTSQL